MKSKRTADSGSHYVNAMNKRPIALLLTPVLPLPTGSGRVSAFSGIGFRPCSQIIVSTS